MIVLYVLGQRVRLGDNERLAEDSDLNVLFCWQV